MDTGLCVNYVSITPEENAFCVHQDACSRTRDRTWAVRNHVAALVFESGGASACRPVSYDPGRAATDWPAGPTGQNIHARQRAAGKQVRYTRTPTHLGVHLGHTLSTGPTPPPYQEL